MGIETAELVRSPVGKSIVDRGIHPHQYLLAVAHSSRIERAGVDDW
jgi:hypothetical protein